MNKRVNFRVALIGSAAIGVAAISAPAAAAGCNGVVNPLVWGCAPWDNNNGPKFPYYKKKEIKIPQRQAQVFTQNGVQMVKDLRTGAVSPVISVGGGNVISVGGLN